MIYSSTQSRADYHSYLKSSEWRKKRQQWVDSGRPLKCFACEKPMPYFDWSGFNFHHRTYKNIFNENLDDLILLCEFDHKELSKEWRELKQIKGHCLHNQTHIYVVSKRINLGLSVKSNNFIMQELGAFHE